MRITRNIDGRNVEIELTPMEVEMAYREKDLDYCAEDVLSALNNSISKEEARGIAECAMNIIEHSDAYFDAYWECVNDAIQENTL